MNHVYFISNFEAQKILTDRLNQLAEDMQIIVSSTDDSEAIADCLRTLTDRFFGCVSMAETIAANFKKENN